MQKEALKWSFFYAYMLAMNCTWVRRLYSTNNTWQIVLSNVDKTSFNRYGDDDIRKIRDKCANKFWDEVQNSLIDQKRKTWKAWIFILASPLWRSSYFQINKISIIRFVYDMLIKETSFSNYEEMCDRNDININIMDYIGIISMLCEIKNSFHLKLFT